MAAMSAKAMRNYVKIMDYSAKKLNNNVIAKYVVFSILLLPSPDEFLGSTVLT